MVQLCSQLTHTQTHRFCQLETETILVITTLFQSFFDKFVYIRHLFAVAQDAIHISHLLNHILRHTDDKIVYLLYFVVNFVVTYPWQKKNFVSKQIFASPKCTVPLSQKASLKFTRWKWFWAVRFGCIAHKTVHWVFHYILTRESLANRMLTKIKHSTLFTQFAFHFKQFRSHEKKTAKDSNT